MELLGAVFSQRHSLTRASDATALRRKEQLGGSLTFPPYVTLPSIFHLPLSTIHIPPFHYPLSIFNPPLSTIHLPPFTIHLPQSTDFFQTDKGAYIFFSNTVQYLFYKIIYVHTYISSNQAVWKRNPFMIMW